IGVGVDFSRFSLGMGYDGIYSKINVLYGYYNNIDKGYDYYLETTKFGIHTFYLKLGIRIGPME
ncbi:MAG: hypothetical protein J5606_03245, partial [Bacteroidales bacterium]|nr:hypothetical protein [Bacteroidales bacterium]